MLEETDVVLSDAWAGGVVDVSHGGMIDMVPIGDTTGPWDKVP